MAELVDAAGLKLAGPKEPSGFDSQPGHASDRVGPFPSLRPHVLMLCLVLACAASDAATERHWQTGTWREVDVKRQLLDFGPGASGFGGPAAPALRAMADVRVYVIETDDLRLELKDVVAVGRRSVDATVGQPVTFALERNSLYVRDPDGKEYRLRVTKKIQKTR